MSCWLLLLLLSSDALMLAALVDLCTARASLQRLREPAAVVFFGRVQTRALAACKTLATKPEVETRITYNSYRAEGSSSFSRTLMPSGPAPMAS